MQEFPLLSVIVISYNNLHYFEECVNSLLIQDYPNIELIFSDDSSEKFDQNHIEAYIKKNKRENIKEVIIHRNSENVGSVKNINGAIKMSTGDYIKLISIDDLFFDGTVLTSFVKQLVSNKLLITASKIEVLNNDNQQAFFKLNDKSNPELFNNNVDNKPFVKMCDGPYIAAPSVCFSKELFKKYGLFDERFRLIEDWPMWLKLTKAKCPIGFLDSVSVKYRVNVGVSNGKNIHPAFLEDRKLCYELLVLSEKNILGNRRHRLCGYRYIITCYYSDLSLRQKIVFHLKYFDKTMGSVIRKVKRMIKINEQEK